MFPDISILIQLLRRTLEMLYGFLVFHFIVVLLEDNKRLKKLLKDRSMPKKVRYTVKSDGFGEFSLLPYL